MIQALLDRYAAAVRAKDVDAFVTLYADDVTVFDMWGQWSYDGGETWRAMATDWFGSLGTEQVAIEFSDVETIESDDVCAAHALMTIRGLSAEGEELRSMQNRLTWVLRKRDGELKVVHEHTSAPLDFETGKAISRRS